MRGQTLQALFRGQFDVDAEPIRPKAESELLWSHLAAGHCDFISSDHVSWGLYIANFNPLQPFPGTPLYDRMAKEKRLVFDAWWLSEDYGWHQALIEPRGMTRQQLTDGCRRCRERFNSFSGMASRFLRSPAHTRVLDNAAVFWATNVVSKLDIRAKSGLRLGSRGGTP